MDCSVSSSVWSGLSFPALSTRLLGLWCSPFPTLPVTLWWASYLAHPSLWCSASLAFCLLIISTFTSGREKERAGFISQDEGWLSFFSQPEVLPLSSGVKISLFPSSFAHSTLGGLGSGAACTGPDFSLCGSGPQTRLDRRRKLQRFSSKKYPQVGWRHRSLHP